LARQLRFEWTIASQRKLLSRAAQALQGRSIEHPSGNPKDAIAGRTIAAVLDGIFAWSLQTVDGRTVVTTTRNRPVAELVPELALRTIRKCLLVLRSEVARCCIAGDLDRVGQSPCVDLWICWSELLEWVEYLERTPVPVRTRKKSVFTVPQNEVHGAAIGSSRCRGYTVDGAAAAPSTVPRLHRPLYDDLDGSETIEENSSSLPESAGRPQGHSGQMEEEEKPSAGEAGSRGSGQSAVGRMAGGLAYDHSGAVVGFYRSQKGPTGGSLALDVDGVTGASPEAVGEAVGPTEAGGGRREAGARDGPSTPNPQPSTSRSELRELLNQRLKVALADELLDIALRYVDLQHVAAVVAYAISREITLSDGSVLKPWGAGAVYLRLSKPDLIPQSPEDGWAAPGPHWKAAWAKELSRRKREAEAERARQQAAVRSLTLAELEQKFGREVDVIDPNLQRAALEIGWRQQIRTRSDLAEPMVRREVLFAYATGKLKGGSDGS
jgi:hypothetical protein